MTSVRRVTAAARPIDAMVRPPGSKSLTIRALVVAALARGDSRLWHPLEAEDTAVARGALRRLGVEIEDGSDPWVVQGRAGDLTAPDRPLDVGASGLTARCLIPVAALVEGETRVVGRDRLPERPMEGVVAALRALGVEVESESGRLPVVVRGAGRLPGGRVEVEAGTTTQFLTGLLMVAPLADAPLTVTPKGLAGAAGYVEMTVRLMEEFGARVVVGVDGYLVDNGGYRGGDYLIEPDASAAVYPMVAAAITAGRVTVAGLGPGSQQPDLAVARCLEQMGCRLLWPEDGVTVDARDVLLNGLDADLSGSPDGAVALAVAALFARGESRLRGLGSLRVKESDRLAALVAELGRLGAEAAVEGDDLIIRPRELSPARVETYRDHRIAMSFALAGLVVPGVEIAEPEVVGKTWPGFWDFLDDLSR